MIIKENLSNILPLIPEGVTLVAAVKYSTDEQIKELLRNNILNLGFNTAQHLTKVNEFNKKITYHFIGHLQRNKVKDIIPSCKLIHSVDSIKLANKISYEAKKIGKIQDILLQIKTDKNKEHGFVDIIKAYKEISQLSNISIKGLMTMPPPNINPRQIYKEMKLLKNQLNLKELSIGMSNDYQIAIQEGATIIRIGRSLFN